MEGGGVLLATHLTSVADEFGRPRSNYGLAELFGAELVSPEPVESPDLYLRLLPSGKLIPQDPQVMNFKAGNGAAVLAETYSRGYRRALGPAIVTRPQGSGHVIYIGSGLEAIYEETLLEPLRTYFRSLLDPVLKSSRTYEVEFRPGLMPQLAASENTLLLHLLANTGNILEEASGGGRVSASHERSGAHPASPKSNGKVRRAHVERRKSHLECSERLGGVSGAPGAHLRSSSGGPCLMRTMSFTPERPKSTAPEGGFMTEKNVFQGKTALVTGASRGIGAETAFALAVRGAFTVIHYNTGEKEATGVLERIRNAGGNGELIQSDLSRSDGIHRFIDLLRQSGRAVDILVNNAGSLIRRTRFLDLTEDLWNQVFTLNLTSAFLITQAVLPGMVERKHGIIVNVTSVAARFGGGLGAIAYTCFQGFALRR